jgi:DNA-binding beta-propeller fold protein YncE
MFTNDGKFVKQLVKTSTPFVRNLALSPDSGQQFLYVGNGKEISIVDRKMFEIVGSIQGPGMLGGGHQIATDAKGNLYVAATGNEMQRLTFKGMSPLASR